MTNISRNTFVNQLRRGVDLKSPELNNRLNLTDGQKNALMSLDRNKDNMLSGDELQEAFEFVDSFDSNGSEDSFAVGGDSHSIYRALEAGAEPGPYHGKDIASAAKNRANNESWNYADSSAPTSPYENLSGNKEPGVTRPSWLKGLSKCNQFVGDALTEAGMQMPTNKMADGTEHYMNAESLPFQSDHFDRVTSEQDIKVGDVLVIDHPTGGDGSAHTEIVTSVDPLKTAGAHAYGAAETEDYTNVFIDASVNDGERCWDKSNGDKIYVLRPIMPLEGE
jgi:hypothetical protein